MSKCVLREQHNDAYKKMNISIYIVIIIALHLLKEIDFTFGDKRVFLLKPGHATYLRMLRCISSL